MSEGTLFFALFHSYTHREIRMFSISFATKKNMGLAMRKVAFVQCGHLRPRSACTSAQTNQGLNCPLTELLATTECMNGEQRSLCYFAHVQDDLILDILPVFETTFSLDKAIPLSIHNVYFCTNIKRQILSCTLLSLRKLIQNPGPKVIKLFFHAQLSQARL